MSRRSRDWPAFPPEGPQARDLYGFLMRGWGLPNGAFTPRLATSPGSNSTWSGSEPLLDIVYIALGLGVFALFGAFAAALRRL